MAAGALSALLDSRPFRELAEPRAPAAANRAPTYPSAHSVGAPVTNTRTWRNMSLDPLPVLGGVEHLNISALPRISATGRTV